MASIRRRYQAAILDAAAENSRTLIFQRACRPDGTPTILRGQPACAGKIKAPSRCPQNLRRRPGGPDRGVSADTPDCYRYWSVALIRRKRMRGNIGNKRSYRGNSGLVRIRARQSSLPRRNCRDWQARTEMQRRRRMPRPAKLKPCAFPACGIAQLPKVVAIASVLL